MQRDGGYAPRTLRAAYYIDDHGETWPSGSPELHRVLATHLRGAALDAYLLHHLGFALVRQTSALIECIFDEESVSPVTLVGVLYAIGETADRPIALRNPADPIRIDQLVDRRKAIELISRIIESKRPRPRYERRPCVIDKTSFAQLWRAGREIASAPVDEMTRLRLLGSLYNGSFTLNELDETNGHFRVSAIGATIARIDPDFAAFGIGKTYHALQDPNYGSWISDTFDEYARLTRECTEFVEADVEVAGSAPRRLTYTRLIVPLSRGPRRLLLVATDVA